MLSFDCQMVDPITTLRNPFRRRSLEYEAGPTARHERAGGQRREAEGESHLIRYYRRPSGRYNWQASLSAACHLDFPTSQLTGDNDGGGL